MNEIIEKTFYGIDFLDANDNEVGTLDFGEDRAARDAKVRELEDGAHPDWPETAVRLDDWQRHQVRQPVRGIDYGPGSVKRRFGGGRAPRGAYQFRG